LALSLGEVIGQIGAVLSVAGTSAIGVAVPKFQKVEKTARKALDLAEEALAKVAVFQTSLDGLRGDLERVKRYRARAAAYAEDAPPRRASDSRPDLLSAISIEELQRRHDQRMDELKARCDELRAELLRERGARHVLQQELNKHQQEFSKYVMGQGESWNDLHRALGQIEGKLQKDSD
jgi:hypothetical protein